MVPLWCTTCPPSSAMLWASRSPIFTLAMLDARRQVPHRAARCTRAQTGLVRRLRSRVLVWKKRPRLWGQSWGRDLGNRGVDQQPGPTNSDQSARAASGLPIRMMAPLDEASPALRPWDLEEPGKPAYGTVTTKCTQTFFVCGAFSLPRQTWLRAHTRPIDFYAWLFAIIEVTAVAAVEHLRRYYIK